MSINPQLASSPRMESLTLVDNYFTEKGRNTALADLTAKTINPDNGPSTQLFDDDPKPTERTTIKVIEDIFDEKESPLSRKMKRSFSKIGKILATPFALLIKGIMKLAKKILGTKKPQETESVHPLANDSAIQRKNSDSSDSESEKSDKSAPPKSEESDKSAPPKSEESDKSAPPKSEESEVTEKEREDAAFDWDEIQ